MNFGYTNNPKRDSKGFSLRALSVVEQLMRPLMCALGAGYFYSLCKDTSLVRLQ